MKILFVHNSLKRFVKIDLEMLKEQYDVEEWDATGFRINPFRFWSAVRQADLVYSWFASWHSFFPVLFARLQGKQSITVVGGYDTANLPQAGYGSQRGGIRKLLSSWVIRLSQNHLTFSESAYREALNNTPASPETTSMIYLGVTPFVFGTHPREKIILTVGDIWQDFLLRKGFLPFVQSARHLPDCRFLVVGRWQDESIDTLRRTATPNVEFIGHVSDEELSRYYREAAVYVQASLHEGFGMSLAEAMSAGCIPVTTRNGSLPEIVGNTGEFLESTDPEEIAIAIENALRYSEAHRIIVRQRIIDKFSSERRRKELYQLVDQLLNDKRNGINQHST